MSSAAPPTQPQDPRQALPFRPLLRLNLWIKANPLLNKLATLFLLLLLPPTLLLLLLCLLFRLVWWFPARALDNLFPQQD